MIEKSHPNQTLFTKEEVLKAIVKLGYFKLEDKIYVLEEREYPHTQLCEGTMCWCAVKRKKEKGE